MIPSYPPGATPLDQNELDGLIPDYITTQGELNELERQNILDASTWALSKQYVDILNVTFAFDLHRRMFNRVWTWAGKQRQSNKTIGVFKEHILDELGKLLGDARFWVEHKTYDWDELGARFHHRLVWIHPFVNGNGRHSRLMTDVLLNSNGQKLFSWGMKSSSRQLEVEGDLRQEYISALQEADNKGKYSRLIVFVRS